MPLSTLQNSGTAWKLQDAKAQFSALVENALRGVPQHVTRRGKKAVVVVSQQDFEVLQRGTPGRARTTPNLIEHLLAIPKEPKEAKKPVAAAERLRAHQERLNAEPREVDFS
jgi:antitoxin Phd